MWRKRLSNIHARPLGSQENMDLMAQRVLDKQRETPSSGQEQGGGERELGISRQVTVSTPHDSFSVLLLFWKHNIIHVTEHLKSIEK